MPPKPLTQPATPPLSTQLLAAARVTEAVLAGQSLTQALTETSPVLRAATQALTFHTMRQMGWADAMMRALIPRPPASTLVNALALVAIALLKPVAGAASAKAAVAQPDAADLATAAMPRYAAHTIVDQTVTAAASLPELVGFKGLLNGSLRRLLRERETLEQSIARSLPARWNHPMWWIALLRNTYPQQWETLLADAQLPAPMTLRVNRRRASVQQVQAAMAESGVEALPVGEHGLVLTVPRPVHQLPGFEQGWWSVQDAGAQAAAPLLQVRDGMRVLDACAAPGGKTAHLLEMADLDLVALDADGARLDRVRQNLDRLGLMSDRVVLQAADAGDLDAWWDGRPFDAVLADVPCTASGIVRRHPDIRWLRREEDIARTAALQARLVDALWRTVAPGGHLLYVTCSIFPAEGTRQATAFARRHPEALRLPAPGQWLPVAGNATPAEQRDGFFYALFAKQP